MVTVAFKSIATLFAWFGYLTLLVGLNREFEFPQPQHGEGILLALAAGMALWWPRQAMHVRISALLLFPVVSLAVLWTVDFLTIVVIQEVRSPGLLTAHTYADVKGIALLVSILLFWISCQRFFAIAPLYIGAIALRPSQDSHRPWRILSASRLLRIRIAGTIAWIAYMLADAMLVERSRWYYKDDFLLWLIVPVICFQLALTLYRWVMRDAMGPDAAE